MTIRDALNRVLTDMVILAASGKAKDPFGMTELILWLTNVSGDEDLEPLSIDHLKNILKDLNTPFDPPVSKEEAPEEPPETPDRSGPWVDSHQG